MAKKQTKKKTAKKAKISKVSKTTKKVIKPGRDPRPIDWEIAARMCEKQATEEEVASVLGFSARQFERRLKSDLGLKWSDFFALHAGRGRFSLRKKIHELAMSGNAQLLLHLGKTVLGQSEKISMELSGPGGTDLRFKNTSDEDLMEQLKKTLSNLKIVESK